MKQSPTKKILFIGTFLSKTNGTKGPTEHIAKKLKTSETDTRLVSTYTNPIIRALHISFVMLFSSYTKVFIDVYSGSAFYYTVLALWLAKIRGKKAYLILHGGKLPEYTTINKERVLSTLKKADHIQTPSLHLKTFFENLGLQIYYLPNPINEENFKYKRDTVKPLSLLWVRAFHEIYNPTFIVKILHRLKKQYPEITLTMIGPDKGQLATCKKLAIELDVLNSIEFIGSVPNESLHQYYQTHSLFVNTTSYESFGVAVMEAASCGIPIISFNVGELPLIWKTPQEILLTQPMDEDAFIASINDVLNKPFISENISINARKIAENYFWENIHSKWDSLINQK